MFALKATLFATYDGFADKRVKDLVKASMFIVDDRTSGDYGADKRLLTSFCAISAEVMNDDKVRVQLSGNVPLEPAVKAWANSHGAKLWDSPNISLIFDVQRGNLAKIPDLALAIESIVAPGQSYTVSSYKYACPRTASSLRKLEQTLLAAWDA